MNKTNHDNIWKLAAADVHKEADENEKDELNQLIRHSENREIREKVTEIHKNLGAAEPLHHSSIFRSWEKINQYFRKKQVRLYLHISKYAAIIIFAFMIGTLFHINREPVPEVPPVYTEVYVPLGQMSELTLYDGTHVWLNSGTTLRYAGNFGEQVRKVELIGEAFFKVRKSEVPFRVKIKNNEVEVLGTTFAAVAYPDEDFSQVTLVEGSVQINDNNGLILKRLAPKQQVNLPDDSEIKITTAEVNTTFYESWINGEIKFDEERLADVARRMERWYNVEIRFTSEEARNIRFTGTVLKNKPIDQSMKAISLLLPIEVEQVSNLKTKDVITISKKDMPMKKMKI